VAKSRWREYDMLIEPNSILYTYAITKDFGFAPNPFHGICTLATCKPRIRKSARVNDWIMGIGGASLPTIKRRCIFLMKVSEILSFEEYWADPRFLLKRPSRNGSKVQMVGDNIYHKNEAGNWIQEDSHHSLPDGSPNPENISRDTGSTTNVLISDYFLYFGKAAIQVNLDSIGYHNNIRDYKKENLSASSHGPSLIENILKTYGASINLVQSDPYHFSESHKRVDQQSGKIL
jgi:hypothetical protein